MKEEDGEMVPYYGTQQHGRQRVQHAGRRGQRAVHLATRRTCLRSRRTGSECGVSRSRRDGCSRALTRLRLLHSTHHAQARSRRRQLRARSCGDHAVSDGAVRLRGAAGRRRRTTPWPRCARGGVDLVLVNRKLDMRLLRRHRGDPPDQGRPAAGGDAGDADHQLRRAPGRGRSDRRPPRLRQAGVRQARDASSGSKPMLGD